MKVRDTPQSRTKPEVRSGALLSSGPHRPPTRLGGRLTLYRRRPAVPTHLLADTSGQAGPSVLGGRTPEAPDTSPGASP